MKINEASREKGRVVFAVDLITNEVVSAAAYHLPERSSQPLLVTALAPQVDVIASGLGRACIPILKACVHEIARLLGRPERLELWANQDMATEARALYGFMPGQRPVGRSSGSVFLIQDAPSLDEPGPPTTDLHPGHRG